MLSEGRVMRGVGGLYEVMLTGEESPRRITCRGRGALRRDDKLLVGDLCLVREEGGEAVIERILPRRTALGKQRRAFGDLPGRARFALHVFELDGRISKRNTHRQPQV